MGCFESLLQNIYIFVSWSFIVGHMYVCSGHFFINSECYAHNIVAVYSLFYHIIYEIAPICSGDKYGSMCVFELWYRTGERKGKKVQPHNAHINATVSIAGTL